MTNQFKKSQFKNSYIYFPIKNPKKTSSFHKISQKPDTFQILKHGSDELSNVANKKPTQPSKIPTKRGKKRVMRKLVKREVGQKLLLADGCK
jgi:hypothetical protein